jgi:hypothetical protein
MATPEQRPEIKFKMTRHHIDAVCEALKASHGLVEPAARQLEMDGGNLRKYIRTHGKCRAVQLESREKIKDKAESELFQLLNAHDWRAIQFTLLTLAKTRGYVLKDATLNTGDMTNVTTVHDRRRCRRRDRRQLRDEEIELAAAISRQNAAISGQGRRIGLRSASIGIC